MNLVPYLPHIAGALLAAFLIFAFMNHQFRQKIRRRIDASYGKVPKLTPEGISYLASYHRYSRRDSLHKTPYIDDITWHDLDMDSVFQRINACSSSVGEEYLYHLLHALETEPAALNKREGLVAYFSEHPRERIALQSILMGLGKRRDSGLPTFLFDAEAKKLKNTWMYWLLAFLPLAGLLLIPFALQALLLVMVAMGINVFIYGREKLALEGELQTMQYFSALLYAAKTINRRHAPLLEEAGLNLTVALKPFRGRGGMLSTTAQRMATDLESFILIFKTIFLVDLLLYNRAVDRFISHAPEAKELYRVIGELDTAICIASYRQSLSTYCQPSFHSENAIEFTAAYHPLLRHPVPNSGRIDNDSLITGSNASGKSTFIKTLAVNSILAQTIHTCCAEHFGLRFAYVASSMALKDDILTGESYFMVEIKSLKRILQYAAAQPCFCFVDEVLRGTNTPERIAASTAILKVLHEYEGLSLVASHDIELTRILQNIYTNYHFSEQFSGGSIEFDYLLKEGPTRSRNALRLLEHMGFEPRIIEEAESLVLKDEERKP